MTNEYTVRVLRELVTISEGQKFFVGKSGSGTTVFGEHAKLVRSTSTQLIFETESGQIVKTGIDNLRTKGKLLKQGYFVSLNVREEGTYIKSKIIAY